MRKQLTSNILMIRPASFTYNEQTAVNNYYQQIPENFNAEKAREEAIKEFNGLANALTKAGVNVIIEDDTLEPSKPDALFPNNWVSFHNNGNVFLYPMFAVNRRLERRIDLLEKLQNKHGFSVNRILDLSEYENDEMFLEGTGSMVLDRENKIAYACLSLRTNQKMLKIFSEKTGYQIVSFRATQEIGGLKGEIYHTNVMMSIGEDICILCDRSIEDPMERKKVIDMLVDTGKKIIFISPDQVLSFAGNMLQLINAEGEKIMVMSTSAYNSLDELQRNGIMESSRMVHSQLPVIEACGGGSARCMIAEVFLPRV